MAPFLDPTFRGSGGNVGIIRSPVRATALPGSITSVVFGLDTVASTEFFSTALSNLSSSPNASSVSLAPIGINIRSAGIYSEHRRTVSQLGEEPIGETKHPHPGRSRRPTGRLCRTLLPPCPARPGGRHSQGTRASTDPDRDRQAEGQSLASATGPALGSAVQ